MPGVASRVALFLIVAAVAACATSLPVQPVTSLRDVAGRWTGSGYTAAGSNALEWTIYESGRVDVVVNPIGGPPITGAARLSLRDDTLFYESATSSGTVTLLEGEGRRQLRYEGVLTRDRTTAGAMLVPAR